MLKSAALMFVGLAAIVGTARDAHADLLTYDLGLTPLHVTQGGYSIDGGVPRFDQSAGSLENVYLDITGTITGMTIGMSKPFLNMEFSDQAGHIFSVGGAVFTTDGPIGPQGTSFSIVSLGAPGNAALFTDLLPGDTILAGFLLALGLHADITFSHDTLTYDYVRANLPEPGSAGLLLLPFVGVCALMATRRRIAAG